MPATATTENGDDAAENEEDMLQKIIARYEDEEEEFLRELEEMRSTLARERKSKLVEFEQYDQPVLGALCSLVGQIGRLRRENRKLRTRLDRTTAAIATSSSGSSATSGGGGGMARGVVLRVGALLDGSRVASGAASLLPRFMARRKSTQYADIRTGARERLASPPRKEPLTASSYSTDISSEAHTLPIRRKFTVPPLVLPEMSDSDLEQSIFTEVTLPVYQNESPLYRPRRSMVRRSNFSSPSEHTSPSSPGSSRDNSENMTSSRSSFLEIIGIRKKKPMGVGGKSATENGKGEIKVIVKKRKRKISENNNETNVTANNTAVGNGIESGKMQPRNGNDKRSSESYLKPPQPIPTSPPIVNPSPASSTEMPKKSFLAPPRPPHRLERQVPLHRQPNRQFHLTEFSEVQNNRSTRYFDETDDDIVTEEKDPITVPKRQPTVIYVDPDELKINGSGHLTDSASPSPRNSAAKDYLEIDHLRYLRPSKRQNLSSRANEAMKAELSSVRVQNDALIEQLRKKSSEQSKLYTQLISLKEQLTTMQNREQLNEALEALSLKQRVMLQPVKFVGTIEDRLRDFQSEIQSAKQDAVKLQQTTINTQLRDQSTNQQYLDQVEKLQRDNFKLVHNGIQEMARFDRSVTHRLDQMSAYDALYAFTVGLVRKLRQLRASLLESSISASRSELEHLHTQSALLITHAQAERLRIQLEANNCRVPPRPSSYHGQDLMTRLINPHLSFLLPFKLHAGRLEKHKRTQLANIDTLAEMNEQHIETEFLRLFDYARCLSQISDEMTETGAREEQRRESTIQMPSYQPKSRQPSSAENSPLIGENRRHFSSNRFNSRPLMTNGTNGKFDDEQQQQQPGQQVQAGQRRPTSMVECSDPRGPLPGNIRRFAEDIEKRIQHDGSQPVNLHKLSTPTSGQVRAIVSSLQDVCGNDYGNSPKSTPHAPRRNDNTPNGSPNLFGYGIASQHHHYATGDVIRRQQFRQPDSNILKANEKRRPPPAAPPPSGDSSSDYGYISGPPNVNGSHNQPITPTQPVVLYAAVEKKRNLPTPSRLRQPKAMTASPIGLTQHARITQIKPYGANLNGASIVYRPPAEAAQRIQGVQSVPSSPTSQRPADAQQSPSSQRMGSKIAMIREETGSISGSSDSSRLPKLLTSSPSSLSNPGVGEVKKKYGWLSRLRQSSSKK